MLNKILIVITVSLILSGCGAPSNNDENYVGGITRDNWQCTDDCSGHEAGYDWAEEKGITDPADCGGNSNSFIEGCEAYANEH